jgi:ankyrin repeat protein
MSSTAVAQGLSLSQLDHHAAAGADNFAKQTPMSCRLEVVDGAEESVSLAQLSARRRSIGGKAGPGAQPPVAVAAMAFASPKRVEQIQVQAAPQQHDNNNSTTDFADVIMSEDSDDAEPHRGNGSSVGSSSRKQNSRSPYRAQQQQRDEQKGYGSEHSQQRRAECGYSTESGDTDDDGGHSRGTQQSSAAAREVTSARSKRSSASRASRGSSITAAMSESSSACYQQQQQQQRDDRSAGGTSPKRRFGSPLGRRKGRVPVSPDAVSRALESPARRKRGGSGGGASSSGITVLKKQSGTASSSSAEQGGLDREATAVLLEERRLVNEEMAELKRQNAALRQGLSSPATAAVATAATAAPSTAATVAAAVAAKASKPLRRRKSSSSSSVGPCDEALLMSAASSSQLLTARSGSSSQHEAEGLRRKEAALARTQAEVAARERELVAQMERLRIIRGEVLVASTNSGAVSQAAAVPPLLAAPPLTARTSSSGSATARSHLSSPAGTVSSSNHHAQQTANSSEVAVAASLPRLLYEGGFLWKVPYHQSGTPKRRWFQLKPADGLVLNRKGRLVLPGSEGSGSRAAAAAEKTVRLAYPLTLIWLDPDRSVKRCPPREMPLADVRSVSAGHKTAAFWQHVALGAVGAPALPAPALCFSLVGADRTLDLAAAAPEDAAAWREALVAVLLRMRNGTIAAPPAPAAATANSGFGSGAMTARAGNSSSSNSAEQAAAGGWDNRTQQAWRQQLFMAVRSGDTPAAVAALDSGCPVDLMEAGTGDTALLAACRGGHLDIVRAALARGARNDPHPSFGQTALQAAVDAGHTDCAALILATAAPSAADAVIANHEDPNKESPLHVAARRGDARMAELLLHHGADPHLVDGQGGTPLHTAARAGKRAVIAALLDAAAGDGEALMETGDARGARALHVAARHGKLEAARLLLETAAEADARDGDGRTPYALAYAHGHHALARLIQEYAPAALTSSSSASTSATSGHTAVAAAAWNGVGATPPRRASVQSSSTASGSPDALPRPGGVTQGGMSPQRGERRDSNSGSSGTVSAGDRMMGRVNRGGGLSIATEDPSTVHYAQTYPHQQQQQQQQQQQWQQSYPDGAQTARYANDRTAFWSGNSSGAAAAAAGTSSVHSAGDVRYQYGQDRARAGSLSSTPYATVQQHQQQRSGPWDYSATNLHYPHNTASPATAAAAAVSGHSSLFDGLDVYVLGGRQPLTQRGTPDTPTSIAGTPSSYGGSPLPGSSAFSFDSNGALPSARDQARMLHFGSGYASPSSARSVSTTATPTAAAAGSAGAAVVDSQHARHAWGEETVGHTSTTATDAAAAADGSYETFQWEGALWYVCYNEDGYPYYLHEDSGASQWQDPRRDPSEYDVNGYANGYVDGDDADYGSNSSTSNRVHVIADPRAYYELAQQPAAAAAAADADADVVPIEPQNDAPLVATEHKASSRSTSPHPLVPQLRLASTTTAAAAVSEPKGPLRPMVPLAVSVAVPIPKLGSVAAAVQALSASSKRSASPPPVHKQPSGSPHYLQRSVRSRSPSLSRSHSRSPDCKRGGALDSGEHCYDHHDAAAAESKDAGADSDAEYSSGDDGSKQLYQEHKGSSSSGAKGRGRAGMPSTSSSMPTSAPSVDQAAAIAARLKAG